MMLTCNSGDWGKAVSVINSGNKRRAEWMKDRNNARTNSEIDHGGCCLRSLDSTARGIYQWDNQTYISGTQIWIPIGRISNRDKDLLNHCMP